MAWTAAEGPNCNCIYNQDDRRDSIHEQNKTYMDLYHILNCLINLCGVTADTETCMIITNSTISCCL